MCKGLRAHKTVKDPSKTIITITNIFLSIIFLDDIVSTELLSFPLVWL